MIYLTISFCWHSLHPQVLLDSAFQLQSHVEDVRKLLRKISTPLVSSAGIVRLKTNTRIVVILNRNFGNPTVLGHYRKTNGK